MSNPPSLHGMGYWLHFRRKVADFCGPVSEAEPLRVDLQNQWRHKKPSETASFGGHIHVSPNGQNNAFRFKSVAGKEMMAEKPCNALVF